MYSVFDRARALHLCVIVVVLVTPACFGGAAAPPVSAPEPVAQTARDSARTRKPRALPRARIDSTALERAVTTRLAHRPLAIALARRSGNPEMADRAAAAVVHEAGRLRLSPSLLAAVLLIENTPLDSSAVSSQGAIGLMQVMPVHAGSYGCLSEDLMNVEANICHGARILQNMLRRTRSIPLALKRYNGCVRGRNTPRCYRYPVRVLRTASRLRRELLVSAAGFKSGGPEIVALRQQGTAAAIPSQPVTSQDTSVTATTASSECQTFFGCLRYRWTLKN